VAPHLPELHDLGGHWHSRHLPAPEPGPAESAWLRTLEAALRHP
jgi:hypothetical protein